MASATCMKAQILQDAVTQQFFRINIAKILGTMSREFYALRREQTQEKVAWTIIWSSGCIWDRCCPLPDSSFFLVLIMLTPFQSSH